MDQPLRRRLRIRVEDTRGLWPFDRVLDQFTYVDWDNGITEGMTPNYANTDVIGRAEQYRHWMSTNNKEIQLTFQFRVQGEGEEAIREEVIRPCRFLEALKSPMYNPATGLSVAPPSFILTIGNLLTARCVLTAGDIRWMMAPMDPESMLPHGAEFPATFTVVRSQADDLSYQFEQYEEGIWT